MLTFPAFSKEVNKYFLYASIIMELIAKLGVVKHYKIDRVKE